MGTSTNAAHPTERVYYDGLGRVAQTQIDNAYVQEFWRVKRALVTLVAYDGRGREVCRAAPYAVGAAANAYQATACDSKPHGAEHGLRRAGAGGRA